MIYQNKNIKIEVENSDIPWLKVLPQIECKEMSQLPRDIRIEIYDTLDVIERLMLEYYNPTKINIASFGNYMPIVHWHIMARFESDTHYPESMWGKKLREGVLELPSFDIFCSRLSEILDSQQQVNL